MLWQLKVCLGSVQNDSTIHRTEWQAVTAVPKGNVSGCASHRDDDSYVQTNGGSRYQHDPEYGGKVSLSEYQNARAPSPSGPEHLPPMPPDHPRVRELIGSEAAARWEAQLNLFLRHRRRAA